MRDGEDEKNPVTLRVTGFEKEIHPKGLEPLTF